MSNHYLPERERGWVVAPIYEHDARVTNTLARMAQSPEAPGHSDIGARNFVHMLVVNLRPRRVLEIGTHIGSGALAIGAALRLNGYGKLLTLEPMPHYRALAQANIDAAQLSDLVQIVPHSSYEDECKSLLQREAPFEIIFIDGAHEYDSACHDIAHGADLLDVNGVMLLHDTGRASPDMDASRKGGVRQALFDFGKRRPDLKITYFEHPLWPNPCGVALLCRQVYDPPMQKLATSTLLRLIQHIWR